MLKKQILGCLTLGSVLAVSANAVDVKGFGHLGTAYSFGTNKNVYGEKPWYGGFTGRLGVELGMGSVSLGLGAAGGTPYAISPSGGFKDYIEHRQFTALDDIKWYNWISDAYLRVDTSMFSFAGGRYDVTSFFRGKDGKEHSGVDWFFGQNEGVSFKLDTRYFAWWGIYSYETMDFGERNPYGFGSDLMGFHQYGKSGHLVSTGFDININDMFYIDPFVTYNVDFKYLQTGGKIQANFGKGSFKSQTIFRGMYQHWDYGYKADTFLFWGDQEFIIGNIFKFGGGGYYVGKEDGIVTSFGQNSRFYGNAFGGEMNNFFAANNGVWYVFAGIEHKYFNFDFLYADGSYKEISAVAQINAFKNQWLELGVGGGWVRSNDRDQGIAFVKLSF